MKNKFNSKHIYGKKYLQPEKKTIATWKEAFNVDRHQQYWLIQFIEKRKIIILKYF